MPPAGKERLRLRKLIKAWLETPVAAARPALPGRLASRQAEPVLPETILHYYRDRLPGDCDQLRYREAMTIALSHLESLGVWFRMVESQAPGAMELTERLFGREPAATAKDCNDAILLHKNFNAFRDSLETLASDAKLSHGEYQRHVNNVRHGANLLAGAVRAFSFGKLFTRCSEDKQVMMLALMRAEEDFAEDISPIIRGRGKAR